MIPDDVMRSIRDTYPEWDYSKRDWSRIERRFPHKQLIDQLELIIRENCDVNMYIEIDRNYQHCYNIEISTTKQILTKHKRGISTAEIMKYLKSINHPLYEMDLQLSMIGAYATVLWVKTMVNQQNQIANEEFDSPPTKECEVVQKCIENILSIKKINVLSWEILKTPLIGMNGSPIGDKATPTVYNCLFGDI